MAKIGRMGSKMHEDRRLDDPFLFVWPQDGANSCQEEGAPYIMTSTGPDCTISNNIQFLPGLSFKMQLKPYN